MEIPKHIDITHLLRLEAECAKLGMNEWNMFCKRMNGPSKEDMKATVCKRKK